MALARYDARPLALGTRAMVRIDGRGAGYTNSAGMGSLRDTAAWTGHSAGQRLGAYDVRELLRGDAMAHRICFREPQDSFKGGFEVRGSVSGVPLENDPEQQKAWTSYLGGFEVAPGLSGVTALAIQARAEAKAFGAAAWVLWVDDGRPSDQPIDWPNIRSIRWIKVLRAGRGGLVSPRSYCESVHNERCDLPETYSVSFPRGPGGIFHWHRVIIWQGSITDTATLADADGWGESVLDRVWTALRSFGMSHQYAIGALLKLSQGVFKSQYLANALEAGLEAEAKRRLEDVAMGQGIYGEIGIGPHEDYTIPGRAIGGVDGLLGKFAEALVAATDMPEVVLMGKRPGGLSTSADGEFRGWYDYLASLWLPVYAPPIVRLIDIASRAHDGPTRGVPVMDSGVYQPPLWQETEAQQLDNRAKAAAARAADLAAGVITPDEARTDPDLDQWYDLGTMVAPPEDAALQLGETEALSQELIPPGESLMSLREASEVLGYRSTQATRNFASQHGALFRVGAQWRVARSLLMAGLRVAQAEPVAPETAAPQPAA